MRWALAPQIQPLRALLFVALAMQFFAAVAAFKASRWYESLAWFALAYLLVVQPVVTEPWTWKPVLVVLGLAALSCVGRVRGLPVLAAFFAIPMLGGVVNYPKLHTPELAQLSEWARSSTPVDSVFLFPDAGARPGAGHLSRRGVTRGVCRLEGRRAGQLSARVRRAVVVPLAADDGPEVHAGGDGEIRRARDSVHRGAAEESFAAAGGVRERALTSFTERT